MDKREQNILSIDSTATDGDSLSAAEERLRLLESAVMNANDAFIILEAEPGQMRGRRILYVNEAFTRMTGYSSEEAMQKTLRMLRGPRTDLRALDTIRLALEDRRPVRVELINYRKDGSEFWAECNIVPFADERGSFVHWVSVQRDISERKKADEERDRLMKKIASINADLSELNRELETIGAERTMSLMALTVADRVRNPATMIGARCRRMLEREELSESLHDGLRSVLEGAESLEHIVRDFENLLKNRKSRFRNTEMNSIVKGVISVLEKEADYREVRMDTSLASDPLYMNMQPELFRVAVFHILKNAVEATGRGGQIRVTSCRRDEFIELNVSDTGHGIEEEDAQDIFQPFYSTKHSGFGMGLPLVRQIITEHLGELRVESNPGKGTAFRMVFPMRWKEEKLYGDRWDKFLQNS